MLLKCKNPAVVIARYDNCRKLPCRTIRGVPMIVIHYAYASTLFLFIFPRLPPLERGFVMQFHEQLDYLMKLTDISNSELSKRANIDPSGQPVARGLKRPEVFSDIVSHIAEILAQRINSDLRRREFAAWLSLPVEELSEPEEITSAVLECFHKNASRPDLKPRKSSSKRPYPTYVSSGQISLWIPTVCPKPIVLGQVGGKRALSWVLSFVEYWTQDSGTLRFYSDQPYEYLNIDCGYYESGFRNTPTPKNSASSKSFSPPPPPSRSGCACFNSRFCS